MLLGALLIPCLREHVISLAYLGLCVIVRILNKLSCDGLQIVSWYFHHLALTRQGHFKAWIVLVLPIGHRLDVIWLLHLKFLLQLVLVLNPGLLVKVIRCDLSCNIVDLFLEVEIVFIHRGAEIDLLGVRRGHILGRLPG